MKCSIVLSTVVSLVLVPIVQAGQSTPARVGPRTTTLAISPALLSTGDGVSLLVKPADQTDGDAVPLYRQAVQAMPTNINTGQLRDRAQEPLDASVLDEVEAFLRRAQPCLELIDKATRCKECNWPAFVANQQPANLSEYRLLTYMVLLKARSEIAAGQCDEAVGTVRMGMTMARQIGEAPTLVQGLVGVAMAAVMMRGVDDLAQAPNSPNLYAALKALPRPLIDVEESIASELSALESNTQYSQSVREVMREQMEPAYERVRQLSERSISEIGARECVEAIRHYAATHDGALPAQLSDIKGVDLPEDPVTNKPYTYRVKDGQAIVETGVPEGGSAREAMRFDITVSR